MATTSWKTLQVCADAAGVGTATWDADDFAAALVGTEVSADDNVYAGFNGSGSVVSRWLKCTDPAFTSVDVPLGSTIDGIEVEIIRHRPSGFVVSSTAIKFVKGGTISGNDIGDAADWPTSEGSQGYGSSSELGGLSWSQADIVSSTFGCAISATLASSRAAPGFSRSHLVEQVRMRVHYTLGTPAAIGPQFMGFFM